MNPAIVIPCYNRAKELDALLGALMAADYDAVDGQVDLIFSIDYSGVDSIAKIAHGFVWPYGRKRIIEHEKNLGLKENILTCGDLTKEYGAVVVLEDDLMVAPGFYSYALAASRYYQGCDEIGQISLYSYDVSEVSQCRFIPIHDGSDVCFIQWASSWGQLWLGEQWSSFREWYEKNGQGDLGAFDLPDYVIGWPESSWKKWYIAYLVATARYVVFPRNGYVTNPGASGENMQGFLSPFFASPLVDIRSEGWAFIKLEDSSAVYDSFFEITRDSLLKLCPDLDGYDFVCDMHGVRNLCKVRSSHILSCKFCVEPVLAYGSAILPLEANVIKHVSGEVISLAPVGCFEARMSFGRQMKHSIWSWRILSPKRMFAYGLFQMLSSLGRQVRSLMRLR